MSDDSSSHGPRLTAIITEYFHAMESGRAPSRQQLIQENCDLAEELTAFFVAQDRTRPGGGNADDTTPNDANTASRTRSLSSSETGDPIVAASTDFEAETLNLSRSPIPPASIDLPLGGQIRHFGDYELLELIGRGGMGVVFRARQISLDRVVAVKMILSGELASAAEVERFHTEAAAAAELDHPGIVPIFEVGERDGHHFFSMGYVEGQSLGARIVDGPLPPRDAAELTGKLALAVAYAHQHGVIHRDIKPDNVLLDDRGQPRITDFGLAKKLESDSHQTRTGEILGTPSFMPPEQAAGKTHEIGPAADIYALGAVLYTMLTGRPPFQAANPMDTLLQVLDKEPIAPRQLDAGVPRDLETICLKCLQKDPPKRYSTADELAADLQRFSEGQPIHARPVGVWERGWLWCKRNPRTAVPSVAATLLALVLMIGGPLAAVLVFQQKERAEASEERAAAKYDVAIDTVRMLIDEVNNELREEPRMQPLREKVVQLAKDQLQNIQDENEDYGRVSVAMASSDRKLGEIYLSLGETQKALEIFKRCLQAARQLDAEGRLDAPHLSLAGTYEGLGQARMKAGQLAEAKKDYLNGLRHWEQRRLLFPEQEFGHLQAIAKSYGHLATLANMRGDPSESREYATKSLQLRTQWVARDPDNLAARRQLAGAWHAMSKTAFSAGDFPGAKRHLLQAIQLLEELAVEKPEDFRLPWNIGRFYSLLGDFIVMNDQPAEAKECYQKAVTQLRQLSESNPTNARLKEHLGLAYYCIATACHQLEEPESAEYYRRALEIQQALFDADPTIRPKKTRLMLALARCGEHAKAATHADELRQNSTNQRELYEIAGCYALCAAAAETEAESEQLGEKYRDRAITALQAAVERGFADIVLLRRDPDLAPIRKQSQFVAILSQLEQNKALSD